MQGSRSEVQPVALDAALLEAPHRRYNALLGEWVLVSPQRLSRPWLGRVEASAASKRPTYDPECYLCPGNQRAEHARNPDYDRTFVFDNDFPALTLAGPPAWPQAAASPALLRAEPERGVCRVVCFSPRHDLSIPELPVADLRRVVDVWIDQLVELGGIPEISHVQIFENRGASMGASNPHPHCQIWATESIPHLPRREQTAQEEHAAASGACLLCEYLSAERASGARIIAEHGGFTALVPFWAVWPFELLILPNRHVTGIDRFSDEERTGLAAMLKHVTMRYDRLFDAPCPYSMGIHQRPTDGEPHEAWHAHVHIFPPVLRSASIHKFMVGFELLAMPQRDLTAEGAAARLRDVTSEAP